MSTASVEDYLASDEELFLSFPAITVDDGSNNLDSGFGTTQSDSRHQFGATDRRIIYLTASGDFKDLDYSHISSIEAATDDDENAGPYLVACCGGVFILSGIAGLMDDPDRAFLALLLGGAMVYGGAKWLEDVNSSDRETIKFITGNEEQQQIEVTVSSDVERNVAAELSRILREQG